LGSAEYLRAISRWAGNAWDDFRDLIERIRPAQVRVPLAVRLVIAGLILVTLAIWLIPEWWMSNEDDGRVQVVTFIVGLGAVGLGFVVAIRLGVEAARQREEGPRALRPEQAQQTRATPPSAPGVDLREAILPNADLNGVELTEARLLGADLNTAQLGTCRLESADLRRTDLRNANLDEAHLQEADLRHADLRGASLKAASLEGAKLDGAVYDESTTWPEAVDPAGRGAIKTGEKG
jgi:hypothetical protein